MRLAGGGCPYGPRSELLCKARAKRARTEGASFCAAGGRAPVPGWGRVPWWPLAWRPSTGSRAARRAGGTRQSAKFCATGIRSATHGRNPCQPGPAPDLIAGFGTKVRTLGPRTLFMATGLHKGSHLECSAEFVRRLLAADSRNAAGCFRRSAHRLRTACLRKLGTALAASLLISQQAFQRSKNLYASTT